MMGHRDHIALVIDVGVLRLKRMMAPLGLGTLVALQSGTVAAGGAPVFDRFLTTVAPFDSPAPQTWSAPALGDLDRDGDLDLVLGSEDSFLHYFENVGSATSPSFVERFATNPFASAPLVGGNSVPVLVDVDGDGLLDLIAADFTGNFDLYLKNVGSAILPAFAVSSTPLGLPSVGSFATVSAGDLNEDGDMDLVVGQFDGALRYFENVGSATSGTFVERTGSANPLAGFFLPSNPAPDQCAAPALGDLDADGDLDVAIGRSGSTLRYLENRGNPTSPLFYALELASNPFNGETFGSCSRVTSGDLDADGDADVVVGDAAGILSALENKMGQLVPSLEIDPNPLGFFFATVLPAADFDGDGDPSLFGYQCVFADNTGSAINPSFVSSSLPNLGAPCVDEIPSAVDLDGDGDFDVSAGTSLRINSGTPTSPNFGAQQTLFPALSGFRPPRASFGDVDGDGDLDAAVHYPTTVPNSLVVESKFFENTGTAGLPNFVERIGSANPLPSGLNTRIYLDDYDGDGDSDAVESTLNSFGLLNYWENVGTPAIPAYRARPLSDRRNPYRAYTGIPFGPQLLPFKLGDLDGDRDPDAFGIRIEFTPVPTPVAVFLENGIIRPSPTTSSLMLLPAVHLASSAGALAAADFDADGDEDLVVIGAGGQTLRYLLNRGTRVRPSFVELPPDTYENGDPVVGLLGGELARLTAVDLDADGKLELVSGDYYGNPTRYYRNEGSRTDPLFYQETPAFSPLGAINDVLAPTFGDLDGDGDLDLVSGFFVGGLGYYENTGTALTPQFVARVGAQNPFSGLPLPTNYPAPVLGDVDIDGDLDVVVGGEDGSLRYLENTGSATAPVFVARTGAENPYDGLDAGSSSAPALLDLDGDGDLDLLTAAADGTIRVSFVPEPGLSSLLASATALLAWLSQRTRSPR